MLELANKHKIIATEWTFSENNYFSRIVSKIKFTVDHLKYLVSYVNPDYSGSPITNYEKISSTEIRKKLSDIAMGKMGICILIKFPYNKLVLRKIRYMYEDTKIF